MHVCKNNEKFITANTLKDEDKEFYIWRVIIGFNFIHSVSQQCVPTVCPNSASQQCFTVCLNSVSQCVSTVCPNNVSQCVPTVCHGVSQQWVTAVCPNSVSQCVPTVCPNSVSSVSQVPTNIGIRRCLKDRLWFPIKGKIQVVHWKGFLEKNWLKYYKIKYFIFT